MIRLKWVALGLMPACALLGGNALAQATVFWTGASPSNPNFDTGGNWLSGSVPANDGTQVLGFFSSDAMPPNGNQMNLDVSVNVLGLDVEADKPTGSGANISLITGSGNPLTVGSAGIWINHTDDNFGSILSISAPLILAGSQTWSITNSDIIVSSPITQSIPGTALAIAVNTSANILLSNANSTFSGGVTLTGGPGAILVVATSSTGPAGAPTKGPVGTGTLTLGSGTELLTPSATTVTLGNNVTVSAGTETIDGALGGDLILKGTVSGPGIIQTTNGSTNLEFDGDNNYSGGTIIFFATLTIGNDHGLGTGPVTGNDAMFNYTSDMPGMGTPSFSFNQSTVDFTMGGGEPTLNDLTLFDSTLNFAADSIVSITDMASDASGSSNAINLNSNSVLDLRVDSPTAFYGTISGTGSNLIVTTGGTGVLDLFGANSYTGGTTIDSNVLVIADNNTALGTGSIALNGGGASLGLGAGVTITNAISTFSFGSSIEGYGTLSPGSFSFIDVSHGSVIVGGKGALPVAGFATLPVPGTLTFGSGNADIFLGNSGVMQFSVMNATGTPGTDFSSINALNSSVNVTATVFQPFTIQLVSVNPATGQAGLANFNDTLSYSWTLLSAQSISGFAANKFTVDDTTDFLNALGGGSFSLSEVGGNALKLTFTPAPEPSTWALLATGLFALGAAVRRRRS